MILRCVIWSLLASTKLSSKFRNKVDTAEWHSNYCLLVILNFLNDTVRKGICIIVLAIKLDKLHLWVHQVPEKMRNQSVSVLTENICI